MSEDVNVTGEPEPEPEPGPGDLVIELRDGVPYLHTVPDPDDDGSDTPPWLS